MVLWTISGISVSDSDSGFLEQLPERKLAPSASIHCGTKQIGGTGRTGGQTTLGTWLDPMADKLLLLTVFLILTLPHFGLTHRLPVWLTVLVISRDVGIVLTVAIVNLAVAPRTFTPSPLGKLATVVFLITAFATLYANYGSVPPVVLDVLVYASLVVTLVSAADYLRRIMRPAASA